ncbi:MAG: hypothetical protein DMG31_18295 [Acidobacteria bacterium]|nr:MAG: hypothetical protein DMG31_18295 [Acidobacteriota bacterium]
MRFRNVFLLLFFASLLSLQSLMAQTPGTGALTGTVKDPSGAVIPNATVTATSVDTGQTRTTMTGGDGVYHFSLLSPGNYRVARKRRPLSWKAKSRIFRPPVRRWAPW